MSIGKKLTIDYLLKNLPTVDFDGREAFFVLLNFLLLLLRTRILLRAALYGFDVHSLSSDKERTKKTTRVSNSVLMGKLNYPLPKNFASKILPIERKISFGA